MLSSVTSASALHSGPLLTPKGRWKVSLALLQNGVSLDGIEGVSDVNLKDASSFISQIGGVKGARLKRSKCSCVTDDHPGVKSSQMLGMACLRGRPCEVMSMRSPPPYDPQWKMDGVVTTPLLQAGTKMPACCWLAASCAASNVSFLSWCPPFFCFFSPMTPSSCDLQAMRQR